MAALIWADISFSSLSNGIFNPHAIRLTPSRASIRRQTFSDLSAYDFTKSLVWMGKIIDHFYIGKSTSFYRIKLIARGLVTWC